MKHLVSSRFSVLALFAALFLAPAFAFAAATTTPFDLNGNGTLDADEPEVVIETDAVLPAGDYHFNALTITNNATLTAKGDPNSLNAFKGVKIIATSLTVAPGASLRADGTGYGSGFGSGASTLWYVGASYGGVGIGNISTSTYGSATHPTDLGSGGACTSSCGGGALRLVVSGTLANYGTISANGGSSSSGGSLYISAGTLTGGGTFSANGGDNTLVGCCYSAAGGGGRIAIYYGGSTFTGNTTALGGKSRGAYYFDPVSYADNGTIGFFDTTNNNLIVDSLWRFQANDSPFNFNKIILKNGSRTTAEVGASITAEELLVDEGSSLTLSGGETLILTRMTITGTSTVTILSEKTLSLTIPNLTVTPGSSLNTDGKGFGTGFGPGTPANQYYGASYGGVGIGNTATSTYGSRTAPTDFGSGSGACTRPSLCGGGALRLIVTDTLANDGTISSNGGGSSSGGSVYVTANTVTGSGLFSANGGNGSWLGCCYAGAGGGGRVAAYYQHSTFTGTSTALAGLSQSCYYCGASYAGDGTVVFGQGGAVTPPPATCCSSVAFLPGLEASRLYMQGTLFENQLWEPSLNANADVRKLYLSSTTGGSLNSNIYTRDAVDEVGVLNFKTSIYKQFLSGMRKLESDGVINKFETLPYDWRKDQRDVATQLVSVGPNGESYSMVQKLNEMASSSPTKKVTLVTHSNGGLVAKEVVEILRQQGKANIIDRIIMVAAPQLGTPKAILETLHGAKFFLGLPSREVTRELAENMKSAYTLLPSREYFNSVGTPIARPLIEFSTTTPVTQNFRNIYGNSISDYDILRKFLRGENGIRTEPEASDVNTPNVLKENFLANSESRHTFEDAWILPEGIEVIQVVGWGLDTPRGVRYGAAKKTICNANLSVCSKQDVIDPQPLSTSEGDGTVVYTSAEAIGGNKYYLDLQKYNNFTQASTTHASILEASSLQNFVTMLIKHEATSTLPKFISSSKPSTLDADKRLRIAVHSPVALHLYDSFGRHTGPVSNPDSTSDLELYEEQIPNTYYWQIGEGQYSGADGATTTKIVLTGKELGSFTLDLEEIIGENIASTTVYQDIPVTASTTATLQAGAGTSTALSLDVDGNGTIDTTITAEGLDEGNLISVLKGIVKTLSITDSKRAKLLKDFEKLEKILLKKQSEKKKTDKTFENLIKQIKKLEKDKLLTAEEASELISIVEQIREKVVL